MAEWQASKDGAEKCGRLFHHYGGKMPNKVGYGIYQHYKGMKVRVAGVGTHQETKERLVIFADITRVDDDMVALYPEDKWFEEVSHDGGTVPRFTLIEKADV